MRYRFVVGAIALAALVGTALPSTAATVAFGNVTPTAVLNLGPGSVGGAATDLYTFTLTSSAAPESSSATFSGFGGMLELFTGSAGASGTSLSSSGLLGAASLSVFQTLAAIGPGSYSLVVSAMGAGPLSYNGSLAFVSAVPLPGAALMLGTALAGLAGVGAVRRRRKEGGSLSVAA